jgi:hypothetical protein
MHEVRDTRHLHEPLFVLVNEWAELGRLRFADALSGGRRVVGQILICRSYPFSIRARVEPNIAVLGPPV